MNTLFGFATLLALWWLGNAIAMVLLFGLAVIRGGIPLLKRFGFRDDRVLDMAMAAALAPILMPLLV